MSNLPQTLRSRSLFALAGLTLLLGAARAEDPQPVLGVRGGRITVETFSRPFELPYGSAQDKGTIGWTVNKPRWEFVPGGLKATNPEELEHGSIINYGFHFLDVIFQTDFQLNGCKRLVVTINSLNDPAVHIAQLVMTTDGLDVVRNFQENGRHKSAHLGKITLPLAPDQWHTLMFEIKGDKLALNLEGKTLILSDPQLETAKDKNTIGFGVWNGSATFRNVRIWAYHTTAVPEPVH